MKRSVPCLVVVGIVSGAPAPADWTTEIVDPGVTPYVYVSEDFLMSGPLWDPDGVDNCPPAGDVRCEWLANHVQGDPEHASNGVIAAVLDGSAVQRAVLLSEVWSDTLSNSSVWWVNYDVHFIVLDPADLPELNVQMRFQHAGVTQLTLSLSGLAGAVHVQHRVAPQHNWFETPETGNEWQIRLTLRRTATGQPAMIWVDNIDVQEGAQTHYREEFGLIPGDTDGDCDVDLADLAALLSGYGIPSGATRANGDLDGDGDVDLEDLSQLLSNYGFVCAS